MVNLFNWTYFNYDFFLGNWYERSVSIGNENNLSDKNIGGQSNPSLDKRTYSLDASSDSKTQSNNVSSGTFSKKRTNLVTTIMLVWLESFEDHAHFPISMSRYSDI